MMRTQTIDEAVATESWIVQEASDADAVAWDAFLDTRSDANFYQTYGWRQINRGHFGHETHFLVARSTDNGIICGVLPLVMIRSRLFGNILSSMPFVNFGGPAAETPGIGRGLLEHATALTRNLGADYAELRLLQPIDESLPTALHKVSMSIDLDADPDRLWQGFSTKHRTNIRRVYKNEIQVQHGGVEMLDEFYALLAQSWRRLGTPIYAKRYFADILKQFPNQTRIFVARHGNTPIATAFNGYYKGTVEGMWAGMSPEHQKLQPNYVLYWEMIKHACENGYHRFHLGRSSVDSNAEQFKKKWNATHQQLYWQYILNRSQDIPRLNVDNPKFRLAIAVWQRLPLSVTEWLGPRLSRSIP